MLPLSLCVYVPAAAMGRQVVEAPTLGQVTNEVRDELATKPSPKKKRRTNVPKVIDPVLESRREAATPNNASERELHKNKSLKIGYDAKSASRCWSFSIKTWEVYERLKFEWLSTTNYTTITVKNEMKVKVII